MGFEAGGACGSDMVQWCVKCCFLSVLKRSVTQILQNWCSADLSFLLPSVQSSHRLRNHGRKLLLTCRRFALPHGLVLRVHLVSPLWRWGYCRPFDFL